MARMAIFENSGGYSGQPAKSVRDVRSIQGGNASWGSHHRGRRREIAMRRRKFAARGDGRQGFRIWHRHIKHILSLRRQMILISPGWPRNVAFVAGLVRTENLIGNGTSDDTAAFREVKQQFKLLLMQPAELPLSGAGRAAVLWHFRSCSASGWYRSPLRGRKWLSIGLVVRYRVVGGQPSSNSRFHCGGFPRDPLSALRAGSIEPPRACDRHALALAGLEAWGPGPGEA